jgi:hypothetical protein
MSEPKGGWRAVRRVVFAGLAGALLLGVSTSAEPPGAGGKVVKKLIEFGWDEPDTAFLRRHIADMEWTPFDGCVFHVLSTGPAGARENFTWKCWGKKAFTEAELRPALDDLKATAIRRFTHNFLRFNTTPADIDWFDDFAAVLANARLAARVAREGRCSGLLFDIEEYEGKLFTYQQQRDAKIKSWDEYAAQTRRRGREVMAAFQEGFPDLTVFLTFGYSLPRVNSRNGQRPLAEVRYGLLAPFLDGLVEAARGRSKLVDGHELSYGYKEPARFEQAYSLMKEGVLPIVADRDKYRRVASAGFGLWMDNRWRQLGWHENDPAKNYFPPEAFGASVRKALERSDEYVWVYTETPRWWSDEGKPVKLPVAYAEAVRRARQGLAAE